LGPTARLGADPVDNCRLPRSVPHGGEARIAPCAAESNSDLAPSCIRSLCLALGGCLPALRPTTQEDAATTAHDVRDQQSITAAPAGRNRPLGCVDARPGAVALLGRDDA
jgi:hypothetical protein